MKKNNGLLKALIAFSLAAAVMLGAAGVQTRAEEADIMLISENPENSFGRQSINHIMDFRYDDSNPLCETTIPQEGSAAKCIWLLPGDTLSVKIPALVPSSIPGQVNGYMVGFLFDNNIEEISKYLAVVSEDSYYEIAGEPENAVITAVANIGDRPVLLNFGGGGGYKRAKGLELRCAYVSVRAAEMSVPVEFKYEDYTERVPLSSKKVSYQEAYIAFDELSAYDISNYYGLNKDLNLGSALNRYLGVPTAEGYSFKEWTMEQSADCNYYITLSRDQDGRQYLKWYLSGAKRSDFYYGEGESLTLTAKFDQGATLTLDAGKGTIGAEGTSSRIFEINTSEKYNAFDLSAQVPVREGYEFAGWFADKKHTIPVTELAQLNVNNSQRVYRLYAGWAQKTAVGESFKAGAAEYTVTKAAKIDGKGKAEGAVAYKCPVKNSSSITIPETVEYKGVTYKVTSVAADAFAGKTKAKCITVAAAVKKAGTNAFADINEKCEIKVPTDSLKRLRKLFRAAGLNKKCTVSAIE